MKNIKMSVQEFAMPSPRRGSIEPSSGFGNNNEKGIELHQQVQQLRKQEHPEYQSEVHVKWTFERGDFAFEVSGRMDGLLPGSIPLIEEIKSSFNIYELATQIKQKRFDHPYFIQALTYGHIFNLTTLIKPKVALFLISSRREESYSWEIFWEKREYELWLDRRLDELVSEARKAEKRFSRRKRISDSMTFPFLKPREGQRELISLVEKGISEKKRMLFQAPTGMGKTIGVLYPSLKEALSRGQRVIYLTPKNSQQAIAEEAIEKVQESGCETRSLTLTAKSKMCLKAEPLCNPEYCEYARDFYDKLKLFELKDKMTKKKKLTNRVLRNLGQKYQVCPFELQLEAITEADTLICDYNYVFGHQSALGKLTERSFNQVGLPNLLVDEAHNLPSRTMSNFSPEISTFYLESLRRDIEKLPNRFKKDGSALLDMCLGLITSNVPSAFESKIFRPETEIFVSINEELKSFLSLYLDSDIEIKSQDVVLRLVFYWGGFTEILSNLKSEQTQFFVTGVNNGRSKNIKITCCDASDLIREKYDLFQNVILFSATLKPFSYYAKLSGLELSELLIEEFKSPFPKDNRKVLIIPQISTKYSSREKNYPKIAQAIERIVSVKSGNYLAFFPSFEFLERVLNRFQIPSGYRVLKQKRQMNNDEVEEVINSLKLKKDPLILFAVQGGVFSEGIDYAGETVIGAFIVGPPLPGFDYERERMKDYYDFAYESGVDYAYTYPAMAKAVQAAGRVIRSESDKGLIVLMDQRFLEKSFYQSLPQDWYQENPKELVSQSILSDIRKFWEAH
jgi:DNA excision repair protein ERCC-2